MRFFYGEMVEIGRNKGTKVLLKGGKSNPVNGSHFLRDA
jgi:hypothetical protein